MYVYYYTILYYNINIVVTNTTQWDKPDGYESDSPEDILMKEKLSLVLKFNTCDENGIRIELLSELLRMRYIHTTNSEICAILSGELSDTSLNKLKVQ